MQYIFIDESGVSKQEGRSSIALVYVSVKDIDIFNQAVLEVEQALKIESFHWSHSAWNIRAKFIEAMSRQDFSVKVAFIRNPFHERIDYEYALECLIVENDISTIIIDGKKGKSYERKMKRALGYRGIRIRKVKTGSDESYPGLRVADALAGLVRYRDDNPFDKRTGDIYKHISAKISKSIDV